MRRVHPVLNGKPDYSKTIPCSCELSDISARRRERLLKMCSLPPKAHDMTFDKFKVYPDLKTPYQVAKEAGENPGKLFWTLFIGTNGNGKTHLSVSVINEWIKAGIAAKYVYVPLLLEELREAYHKRDNPDSAYEERYKFYREVPLLLMDDLGVEASNPWVKEKLDTILDYRLMNHLSLIATSNLSLEKLPDRIRSRFMRHPQGNIVAITAEEYSLRKNGVGVNR